ncbi:MAG: DUF3300 domain-containing protein [Desulforhopalus sp.]
MKTQHKLIKLIALSLVFLMIFPPWVFSQNTGGVVSTDVDGAALLPQEKLDQLLAPIALYPDSLLAQIFMASTYPLEVVQSDRWVKQNDSLKGDELTTALESQDWDPSIKSLVNFPEVLTMMSEELEWTQQLGDAFLAQQKDVMDTVQTLRGKAQTEGNLKTTEQHTVVVEKETQTIVIEPADPQVIYVPMYNPTIVYGPWWSSSYPPYHYYPPGYVAGVTLFSFGVGIAVGAAWGYAWGGCNWRRGNVDVNINRNININKNINRNKYSGSIAKGGVGRGEWQHNPSHRKGVSYRDQNTAAKYNRGKAANTQSREAFRGRADAGRQELSKDGGARARDQVQRERPTTSSRKDVKSADRGNVQRGSSSQRLEPKDRSAFGRYEKGSRTRSESKRGRQSLSSHQPGGSRNLGGGGRGGGGRRR